MTLRDGIENREEKLAAVHATSPHAVSVTRLRIHSRSVRSFGRYPRFRGAIVFRQRDVRSSMTRQKNRFSSLPWKIHPTKRYDASISTRN